MKSDVERPYTIVHPHALPGDEVLGKLDCSPDGFSADEAAKRLEAVGPNRLPAPTKEVLLKRFFKHFHDLLVCILIVAVAVSSVFTSVTATLRTTGCPSGTSTTQLLIARHCRKERQFHPLHRGFDATQGVAA